MQEHSSPLLELSSKEELDEALIVPFVEKHQQQESGTTEPFSSSERTWSSLWEELGLHLALLLAKAVEIWDFLQRRVTMSLMVRMLWPPFVDEEEAISQQSLLDQGRNMLGKIVLDVLGDGLTLLIALFCMARLICWIASWADGERGSDEAQQRERGLTSSRGENSPVVGPMGSYSPGGVGADGVLAAPTPRSILRKTRDTSPGGREARVESRRESVMGAMLAAAKPGSQFLTEPLAAVGEEAAASGEAALATRSSSSSFSSSFTQGSYLLLGKGMAAELGGVAGGRLARVLKSVQQGGPDDCGADFVRVSFCKAARTGRILRDPLSDDGLVPISEVVMGPFKLEEKGRLPTAVDKKMLELQGRVLQDGAGPTYKT